VISLLSSRRPVKPRTWKLAATAGALLTALALATVPAEAGATATTGTMGAASPVLTSEPTTGPAGVPVPKGFVATSVTFTSLDQAYVLGTAPCTHKPCTSIVRTLDRGAQWRRIPTPKVPVGSPYGAAGAAFWGIRFATPLHGFVFGDALWETTDGGAVWAHVKSPATAIHSLVTIDGQVLALTQPCTPAKCTTSAATLYRRALSGGSWHKIATLPEAGGGSTDQISTEGKIATILDGSTVLVTTNGGLSLTRYSAKCGPADIGGPAAVAAIAPHGLALLCAGQAAAGSVAKTLYLSSDLGAHWTKVGTPPIGGDPADLAATPGHIVVSAISGASWLYYSTTGAHWSNGFRAGDGGLGFADLGFTTTTAGVAVRGPVWTDGTAGGLPGWLLLTSNGGASWHRVTF
jgi:hypothetical protein